MLPFIPAFVLLSASLISATVHALKFKFKYYWLLAVISAVLAWLILLISKIQVPSSVQLVTWKPVELFPVSPALMADNTAWMFAVAISTITLSTFLLEATQRPEEISTEINFIKRIALLAVTAISLLGVMAGNILTLLLIWVLLDISETIIWLQRSGDQLDSQRFIFNTFTRLISLVLLFFAAVISIAYEMYPGFEGLSAPVFLIIAFAAGLRIAVPMFKTPHRMCTKPHDVYASILGLVPMAASLIIIVRLAGASIVMDTASGFLFAAGILSILSGLLWISRESVPEALPFWMVSASAVVLASSMLGERTASLTWAITALMCAALISLFHTRRRWAGYILMFGLLNLSSLPFFASWKGILLYTPPVQPVIYIYLIVQGTLVAGYYRFIKRQERGKLGAERWILLMYPFALALLPVTHLALAYSGGQPFFTNSRSIPDLFIESWPGYAASLLGILIWLLFDRNRNRFSRLITLLFSFFTLEWLFRISKKFYAALDRSLSFGNAIFEGRGGIFWSILLLVLVIAVIVQT